MEQGETSGCFSWLRRGVAPAQLAEVPLRRGLPPEVRSRFEKGAGRRDCRDVFLARRILVGRDTVADSRPTLQRESWASCRAVAFWWVTTVIEKFKRF